MLEKAERENAFQPFGGSEEQSINQQEMIV